MSAPRTVLVFEPEGVRFPADVGTLEAFRRWALSDEFPERGRIDWVDGEVRFDMSPEDLNTHGSPKAAIAQDLGALVRDGNRGVVYIDRARLTDLAVGLSAEPDVTVVLFESVESGRVQLTPRASREAGRFIEIQGAVDLVVECVSDSSEQKDRRLLPPLYHAAGVREFWLVDARVEPLEFTVFGRRRAEWKAVEPDADGFRASAVLGVAVRLVRLPERAGLVRHRLESR